MGNVPPTSPGDAHDLRNLLEAVALPYEGLDHARRMETRADWVRATLKGALAEDPAGIGWNTDFLRGRIAAEETDAAERERNRCRRCRRPFDPADTRFDGRARHRDTAYCRACVDNCHEGGAEHVCVICDPARYGGGSQ